VAVTSRNEETDAKGIAKPAEKAERRRIYNEFYAKKLPVGDVHVYILAPDKSAVAALPINLAMDSSKMIPFLEGIVTRLHLSPGSPPIQPHPTSRPPAPVADDALVIHLVSRALTGGSWHEFPSENWIVLSAADWRQLLPPGKVTPKESWTIPAPVAARLAEWVYPQNEEKTGENRSKVEQADFRFTAVRVEGAIARARIEGRIRLLHSFYPNSKSLDYATSDLTGYLDFDMTQRRIQRLRIVTDKGQYVQTPFAASLVSMSKETLAALQ
jgi:hypothetical protein